MDNDKKTDDDARIVVDETTNVGERRAHVEKSARVVGQVRTAMQLILSEVPYT